MKWTGLHIPAPRLPRLRMPKLGRGAGARRAAVWGRVRTAAIAALLACNLALLAVSAGVTGYDLLLECRARGEMDELLASRGILCGSSVYRALEDCPRAYTLRADSAVQKAFAEALLTGTVTSAAGKGNTAVWTGENGTVSWAASGDLAAEVGLYSQPESTDEGRARALVQRLLTRAGIEARDSQLSVTQTGQGYVVTVQQEIDGVKLLGCSITVTIAPGNETRIAGKWCTGEARPMHARALESYSPQQMILWFVGARDTLAQIISAQPVYVLSDRSGGRFTAIPCWRFATDSGDYVLNTLTGDVIASADIGDEADEADEADADAAPGDAALPDGGDAPQDVTANTGDMADDAAEGSPDPGM